MSHESENRFRVKDMRKSKNLKERGANLKDCDAL